jgi:hypothetical protein
VNDLPDALEAQADGVGDGADGHPGTVSVADDSRPLVHEASEHVVRLCMPRGDLHQSLAVIVHGHASSFLDNRRFV